MGNGSRTSTFLAPPRIFRSLLRELERCKRHASQVERRPAARKAEMLSTHYFHVTETVPEELRRPNHRMCSRM